MNKKYLRAFLFGSFFIYGKVSKPCFYAASSGDDSDTPFVQLIAPKKKQNKKCQKISFVSKNGLNMRYSGFRYSESFLKGLIAECSSSDDELDRLSSLPFDSIEVDGTDVRLIDPVVIKNVKFELVYRDDNQVKSKVYTKPQAGEKSLTSYYSSYLQETGLKIDEQDLEPIKESAIEVSLRRLYNYFNRRGYVYVDIGYRLEPKKDGTFDLVYEIDLDECRATKVNFEGGLNHVNLPLRAKMPKYQIAAYEISQNYILDPNFVEIMKAEYKNHGYCNASIDFYYNLPSREICYIVRESSRFKIGTYDIDFLEVDDFLSKDEKIFIEKILNKDDRYYSFDKVKIIQNILHRRYYNKGFFVQPKVDVNKEDLTVSILFALKKRNTAPKKVLKNIKCTGNRLLNIEHILFFLRKKRGDMISGDDLDDLKGDLFRTECFTNVTMNLEESEGVYDLVIEVKEVPMLWDFGQPAITVIPTLAGNISLSKKNWNNSGTKVVFMANGGKTEDKKRWYGNCSLSLRGYLPNGNSYEFGGRMSIAKDETKSLTSISLLNPEAGQKVDLFLNTQFGGFSQEISLIFHNVKGYNSSMENPILLHLKTYLLRKNFRMFESVLTTDVNSELDWNLKKKDSIYGKLIGIAQHHLFLNKTGSLRLLSVFNVGHGHSFGDDPYHSYLMFQSLYGSDLGVWGPMESNKKTQTMIGGSSRIGAKFKTNWVLTFGWIPDFIRGVGPFAQVEVGSIFHSDKPSGLEEFFRAGSSFGIQLPIMGGVLILKAYYFIPLNYSSGLKENTYLTKKGWQFNWELDMSKLITDNDL